jgi:hypothetical protein
MAKRRRREVRGSCSWVSYMLRFLFDQEHNLLLRLSPFSSFLHITVNFFIFFFFHKNFKQKKILAFASSIRNKQTYIGFLLFAEIEMWQHPRQGVSFACEPELRWGAYRL